MVAVGSLTSIALPPADVAVAEVVLVREGDVVDEDLYAAAAEVVVEGDVQGDLLVLARQLRVTGTVQGDILGTVGGAVIGGEVGGSVRLAAGEIVADGTIADDLAALGGSVELEGEVGRDVLGMGGSLSLRGSVERALRGNFRSIRLDGRVGGDVEVAVEDLRVGPSAVVAGKLAYRPGGPASISGAAEIGGELIERGGNPVNIRVRAAQFLVRMLGFLAFVVTGLALLLISTRAAAAAVEAAVLHPWRSGLLGFAGLALSPVLAVLLALTVVGLPIALLLLSIWAFGLFAGPVPAVAALGQRLLRGRRGLFGGFVLGAPVWGALLLVPYAGPLVYLVFLVWGMGAWLSGAATARRGAPESAVRPRHGEDLLATREP